MGTTEKPDGSLELPNTLGIVCRSVSKKLERFEDFNTTM